MAEALMAALEAFCDDSTVSSRERLLVALMSSELLVPVAEKAPGQPGLQLAFTLDGQGRTLAPAFTDETRLRSWLRTGGAYAKAPAQALIGALMAGPFDGLVVNPGTAACAMVDRRVLHELAAGKVPQDGAQDEPSVHGCDHASESASAAETS